MNEIERDSYAFMKPRFKEEIQNLKEKLSDLESKETNYTRYLNSGINLLQNLRYYYEAASLPNKQKLIGSIFPESLIIENGKCRTVRENEVIRILKGFEKDLKRKDRENPSLSCLVAPAGIEPASSESESEILSIEIRSQNVKKKTTGHRPATRCKNNGKLMILKFL